MRSNRFRLVLPALAALLGATGSAAAQGTPVPAGAQPPRPPALQATPVAAPDSLLDVDRVVAVVGSTPILYSELLDELNIRRARGLQLPESGPERLKLERDALNEMVDAELLVQKANDEKVELEDDQLNKQIDRQMEQVRKQFRTEDEFRTELRRAGFGTPEDYRRRQLELLRRSELQREVVQKLRRDQKLASSPVSDQELNEAYEQSKANIPKREAQVGFRQIVVANKPTPAAKRAARAKAESLLVELSKGGNFEQIAKRESMDPGSGPQGGDLGWNRRGNMVKEFDEMMFALPVGRISPIVETAFGYHIIRVDRAQPAEVKARHILIRPALDSGGVARAQAEADSVLAALKRGADFDSLSARHHDQVENASLPEFPRDSLPPAYAAAIGESGVGALVGPFAIDDPANKTQKFVVLKVTMAVPAGDYPESEVKQRLREQVSEAKTVRKLIDNLRKGTFVSIRLDGEPATAAR
ncbi:peptidylprolyl isomerase [Roseisolibacter sp. H3M3-2]|uniref:peptidylprolyl isomerase n=1 Tax=Roseisolibacter sp. H3M3-2 TaxID=3031323 RepID=UPI0023D9A72E|nr:peptidylprolyl isomerase [Roseisolibacter sp. H3M3-2]MDF1503428.1 peptidylprolyl isomerase [Roseisolibacter sp. H3M3-2]